jgi:hypothetical protein
MWWWIAAFCVGCFIWGCFDQKQWQKDISEIIKVIFWGGLILIGAIFVIGGIAGWLKEGWQHL